MKYLKISGFVCFLLCCSLSAFGQLLQSTPEILIQNGHSHAVLSVAISPDGKMLASGSEDGMIKLWAVGNKRLLNSLVGHSKEVRTVAFSDDGKMLASASWDRTVKLWNVGNGSLLATISNDDRILCMALSPDGKSLAVGCDQNVKLWQVSDRRLLHTLTGHTDSIYSLSFSPDSKILATTSPDRTIRLWDVSSGTLLNTLSGSPLGFEGIDFSPDGKLLVAAAWDTVVIWEVGSWRQVSSLSKFDGVFSIVFSSDGRFCATGTESAIYLWEVSSWRLLRSIKNVGLSRNSTSIAFSPDGNTVVSGSRNAEVDFWETNSGLLHASLRDHTAAVYSIALSPDGKILASGGRDGTTKIWDAASGRLVRIRGDDSSVDRVAFSPDGRVIAAGVYGEGIRLWDMNGERLLNTLKADEVRISTVAFSPNGKIIAGGGNADRAGLWEVGSGRLVNTIPATSLELAFSPDGKILATGGFGNSLQLWDVDSGRLLKTLTWEVTEGRVTINWVITENADMLESLAFSPNGRALASGSFDSSIKLWDVDSRRLVKTLEGHGTQISAMTFSSDGKLLAAGSSTSPVSGIGRDDTTIELLDVDSGRVLKTLVGHANGISSVAFNHDGKVLISGSLDGTIKYWDLFDGKCIATVLAIDKGDYIVYTPDGYFDCSPGAAKYVTYKVGNTVYGLDQYEAVYRRPDIIAQRLGGEVSQYVAARLSRQQQAPEEFVAPPMLAIIDPSGPAKTQTETAQVKLMAMDGKYPITSIMVKVNDRPIPGSSDRGIEVTQKGLKVTQSFSVPLVAGENLITTAAYNEKGIRSDFVEVRVTLEKKSSGKNLFLLALAVNDYPRSASPSKWHLERPEADAQALAAAFSAQKGKLFQDVQERLLLGRDATLANFSSSIYEFIKSQAQPEDVVVIYLAGHGVMFDKKYYYVTADADPDKPYNGLNWSVFEEAMKNDLDYISKVVVINDTCKSGALTRGGAMEDAELFRQLSEGFGVYHLSATTSTEDALDGVFTQVLTDGIGGKADANGDGVVTLEELNQYVRTTVTKVSGGRMHPQLKDIQEGMDFPIAVVK